MVRMCKDSHCKKLVQRLEQINAEAEAMATAHAGDNHQSSGDHLQAQELNPFFFWIQLLCLNRFDSSVPAS